MKKNLETLAAWWCEQVTTNKPNWDNGDNSAFGGMAFLLANTLASKSRKQAPFDAPEKFKKLFVEKALQYHEQNGHIPEMSVDYHPSQFLSEVAREAGIDENAFPCKSHSIIRDGKAYAKCGYGNQLEEITSESI